MFNIDRRGMTVDFNVMFEVVEGHSKVNLLDQSIYKHMGMLEHTLLRFRNSATLDPLTTSKDPIPITYK
uniref:Uncharacterized protein n=1 Tax=Moniliophthora roreri TaxID=221103 RepID=A0A0W0EZX7_MONRR